MSSKSATESPTWSLAVRLTLWYALSSFLLLTLASGFLYWALVHNLESEDDQFMAEKVELVLLLLSGRGDPRIDLPGEEAHRPTDRSTNSFHLRVLGAENQVQFVTAGMEDVLPSALFPVATDGKAVQGREHWLPDGRCFRLASVRIVRPDRPPVLIEVAMDRTQEEHLLAAYRRNLAVVLGLSLLLSAALGYRIARHGLRPVADIAETASRIRSSTLQERIETGGLPAEIRTLGDTFNAMLDRLEQSFARLRQFSSNIAHELRTPLNNMRGEVEVALSKPRTVEEYREVLGSSLEDCGRLSGMIDSLLFLARAENPHTVIDRESLELGAELARVREFYEAAAAESGVQLVVEVQESVRAELNRSLFQRAVANLIRNALAHTPSGGTVTLWAGRTEKGITVEVIDTGQGIPANHLAHIFERFYRVDAARPSTGGVGLGLAIVRSIVELHGGKVEADSVEQHGTRIRMVFGPGSATLA